mmetsp:Transcript_11652/g.16641  ORF Transcript_11652/g.16641 Transcript_11652/m.16641 type:complete len:271 (-) Transcript_11652:156-968(-)|eukprot:CAMPEP_0202458928 /NCGR_PEP_ID=MMETSP1360-20130828/28684_1 /ASSEMBLY_ACC=CAM_ASM_000848 /TAXON_ID=515479 /ORGANISM="Licmophora paradoxa, Strain CCMP2313" /LENGTH=270 /DNA_ID=CAMNT_0049079689 /DNA_START=87 /DNA_END=899 /DNA_ORIENTATION=-
MTAIKTPKSSLKLAHSRAQFIAVASKGISELMNRYGYSRSRASATLMQHISDEAPTDDEIFQMMEERSIGSEEARVVLSISKAFEKIVKERNLSLSDSVDYLTSRLTLTRLAHPQQTTSQKPRQTETLLQVNAANPLMNRQHSSSSILERQSTTATTNSMLRRSSKKPFKTKSLKAKQELRGKGLRKRTISDDNNNNNNNVLPTIQPEKPTRDRADSLTEQVNAKLSEKVELSSSTSSRTTTNSRNKRNHLETPVAAQPNIKRARTSSEV